MVYPSLYERVKPRKSIKKAENFPRILKEGLKYFTIVKH